MQIKIPHFNKNRPQKKCFLWVLPRNSLQWRHFIEVAGLLSRFYKFLKKSHHTLFRGCLQKVSENSQNNVFNRVTFKQFELSNLLPISLDGFRLFTFLDNVRMRQYLSGKKLARDRNHNKRGKERNLTCICQRFWEKWMLIVLFLSRKY